MVVLKIFESRMEAEIVKSLLAANGISSLISADDQAGMRPAMAFGSGVKVLVQESDAQRSHELLAESEKKSKDRPG